MSYSGIGMLFTTSGKRLVNREQNRYFTRAQAAPPQIRAQAAPPQINAQAVHPRDFAPGRAGFRKMDFKNLKSSKSCGSCGH